MTDSSNKPSTGFWVISVLALVWNVMGVKAYVEQAYMTAEDLMVLPEAEQAFYNNLPAWVTAAFALAVFAGAFGSLALLLRKKWATPLFILSIIAVLVQFVHNFFIQDFMEVTSVQMIWSFVIIAIAVFLFWFSKNATVKGWLT